MNEGPLHGRCSSCSVEPKQEQTMTQAMPLEWNDDNVQWRAKC